MKLLDTTFLIHYWAGTDAAGAYLDEHEETSEFVTTPLNLKELVVGRSLRGEFDRHGLRSTFDWVRILPFGTDHAFVAGQLEADLRRAEHNQDRINAVAGDLLIAAVARTEGATVVTRNVDDFALFDDVTVETY